MSANKQYICGIHAVSALLSEHPERVLRLCVAKGRMDKKMDAILSVAKELSLSIEYSDVKTLDRLASDMNHQGVIAFCTKPATYDENDLKALIEKLDVPPFLLVLDGVQDPHNLGACFRSADAAGVHAIIAPKDKSAGMTPTVSKVACGAAEVIPFIQVTNLVRALEMLKEMGIWTYGAAGEAKQSLYQAKLKGPIAIVLGAEGEGLRRLTREHCDFLLNIPMKGSVSSLNVSVAAGVFLFEALRQRS